MAEADGEKVVGMDVSKHTGKAQDALAKCRKHMGDASRQRYHRHEELMENNMTLLERDIDRAIMSAELLIILYQRMCQDLPEKDWAK